MDAMRIDTTIRTQASSKTVVSLFVTLLVAILVTLMILP
jgi:hypothetical protein